MTLNPKYNTVDNVKAEQHARSVAASALQQQAIRPQGSVLVGASAGTGKTYVLTRRFLRILLQDTTCRPADILAVTFTKAAAAEMRNRITKELMDWATHPQDKLEKELKKLLEVEHVPAEITQHARSLFPLVLDDGSMLKIMTIHSFCQSLLSQFPLEAELPPGFGVIEGRESDELIHQSIQQMYQTAPLQTGAQGWAFSYLVTTAADTTLADLFKSFLHNRRRFERLFRSYEHVGLEGLLQVLAAELGLSHAPELTKESIDKINTDFQAQLAEQFLQDRETLKEIYSVLSNSNKLDSAVAFALEGLLSATSAVEKLRGLNEFVSAITTINKDGELAPKVREFATAKRKEHPQLFDAFCLYQQQAIMHQLNYQSLRVYLKTAAFLTLTHSVLQNYKNLKARQGVVDFEDLIYYAQRLLAENQDRGDWVRFKMDGRISHIMLDEAQDTDNDQWHILRALVEEFFSGHGQYDGQLDRTFFAVGDTKQSIYRFRGAQPHVFGGMAEEVGAMAAPMGHQVLPVGLNTSFRSSDVVLEVVDTIFSGGKYRKAVDGEEGALEHKAYRIGVGGTVELWPLYENTKKQTTRVTGPEDWQIPGLDDAAAATTQTPRDALFADLAKRIKDLVDARPYLGASEKRLDPSDVMVLFRAKTHMQAFVDALAAEGALATISGDINLTETPAIQDLMSVVRFLANPSDTLSLVHGMRSPLFGFDDVALENWRKATKDGRSYWASLLNMTEEPFVSAATLLKDLLNNVDAATPYQSLLQLLDRTEGRARLAKRYTGSATGAAADTLNMVIDGFLNAALDYARTQSPSLLGFISWFDKGDLPLKLEASKSQGAVRLMTVHASKGLESGVVVLPDAAATFYGPNISKENFFWQVDGETQQDSLMLCRTSGKPEAPLQAQLKEAEREAVFDDEMRLLYVALTRACDHLIVAGIGSNLKPDESFYSIIERQTADLHWFPEPETGRKILTQEAVIPAPVAGPAPEPTPAFELPEWMFVEAETPEPPRQFHVATDEGTERRAADLHINQENIYRNGLLLHRLLEVLPFVPAAERAKQGASFLRFSAADLSDKYREKLLQTALNTIEEHQTLFENAQGEVALAAAEIGGRVDLLKVEGDTVTIVDYKTNVNVPETIPAQYRKQLQAYGKAAAQIWPQKRIKCAVLWVNAAPPRLQWLDS